MDKHLITSDAPIIEALAKLNALSGEAMTLFVIDEDGKMTGTLTDGDIRRALVGGYPLESPVSTVIMRNFRYVTGDTPDVKALREFRKRGISLVPWLNPDHTIREIIDLTKTPTRLPLSAILMAGGKGERLRPLTLTTPKPLLELGGKAIIDYNIEALARCGISDISVTIKYLADMMRRHFATPVGGVNVKCVEEQEPLGTIGAAALCDLPEDGSTIVMNSDILTNISFEDMYLHHSEHESDITMAVVPYQVSVPFAIVSADTSDPAVVTGLKEKPVYSYFANAGIYIFPNNLLRKLPTDRRTDATDLIESAITGSYKVSQFPVNGTWIDIGSPADFRQAAELLRYVGR